MSQTSPAKWKPGKRDAVFAAIVAAVIVLLAFGSGERTTKPTPNDKAHTHATSRQACMACHGSQGVQPRPIEHHAKGDQCFQCHTQPKDWLGKKQ
ncbi:MAG: hypothetical protein Q9M27_01640 [Mariprofundaceae bacterium]|nr:hypothetical protein [Mariprofundaceae bacterium]